MSQQVGLDLSKFIDREGDDYPVFLLEFSHPKFGGEVLRICSSNVQRLSPWPDGQPRYGVRSRVGGSVQREYTYVPILMSPPGQEQDGAPTANFTVFRTDELVAQLRSVQTPVDVAMYQVWAKEPDILGTSYPGFKLGNIDINGATITGRLGVDIQDAESFPGLRYERRYFGGVR